MVQSLSKSRRVRMIAAADDGWQRVSGCARCQVEPGLSIGDVDRGKSTADRSASSGRTSRVVSRPLFRNTSVGHNLIRKDRPRGRPLASAILIWRTRGCPAKADARSGCAAREYPHHGLPNSSTVGPSNRSISARVGSVAAYCSVIVILQATRRRAQCAHGAGHQVSLSAKRTSAIQLRCLRARRDSTSSPSKLAACLRSREGSTSSSTLTLTTA